MNKMNDCDATWEAFKVCYSAYIEQKDDIDMLAFRAAFNYGFFSGKRSGIRESLDSTEEESQNFINSMKGGCYGRNEKEDDTKGSTEARQDKPLRW